MQSLGLLQLISLRVIRDFFFNFHLHNFLNIYISSESTFYVLSDMILELYDLVPKWVKSKIFFSRATKILNHALNLK